MPRSERDIFTDHVAALLRPLGVALEDMTRAQRERLVNRARRSRLNEHEAALTLAHGFVIDLLERDVERARVLMNRLTLMAAQWKREDLVKRGVVTPLEREFRAALRRTGA